MVPTRARRTVPVVALVLIAPFVSVPLASAQTQDVTVSPITAYLDQASVTTEYTVQVAAPTGADLQVVWSTPPCGEWSTPVPTLFRWTHEHPPCTDPLLHPTTVITVVVTIASADVEFTCRYRGAGSGTGKPCARRSLGLTPSPTTPPPSPSVTASPSATPSSAPSAVTLPPLLLPAIGGLAVFVLVVLAASFLGDGLRDALDPRQRVESN